MSVRIEGMDSLEKKLKNNYTLNDVKRVVRKNGSELQIKIQRNADFKKGYQTGATHDSIRLDITDGGMVAESGPTTEYAPYLEEGTRFMHAQPFVKPALEEVEPKFKADMQKLVK